MQFTRPPCPKSLHHFTCTEQKVADDIYLSLQKITLFFEESTCCPVLTMKLFWGDGWVEVIATLIRNLGNCALPGYYAESRETTTRCVMTQKSAFSATLWRKPEMKNS